MYDHERLDIDARQWARREPTWRHSHCESKAKLAQLSELADTVQDTTVGFILSELIDMVSES